MNAFRLCLVLALTAWSFDGLAAGTPLANQDCREILEHAASDAKSVPKRLVDECKKQLAAAPAPAVVERPMVASAAAVDPCAGPNAADSALCWGPWAGIAPAAAAPLTALNIPEPPGDCDSGSEIANRCVPLLEQQTPTLPLGSCTPGTPCGFATVVAGVTSSGDSEDTSFARFDLAPDGSHFTVDPDGANEIDSVAGMSTTITSRNDGYENLRSQGRAGDEQSRLIARVVRDDGDQIQLAADIWGHGNRATQSANSGYFAWGMATTPAGLESLNNGNVSVNFAGPMSVDNSTTASLTVNFGTQPTWSGNWTNPAYSFGAGGAVTGVDLISSPDQFTSNVVPAGSFVQGAVLGEPGSQGLAHIIDVRLTDERHIKDVGLLREVVTQPIADIHP